MKITMQKDRPSGLTYRTTRKRSEVESRYQSLGTHVPIQFRQLFKWLLKESDDFPDLTEAINYELPIQRITTTGGANTNVEIPSTPNISQMNSTSTEDSLQQLIENVLSSNGHNNSYKHLTATKPPAEGFLPVPTVEELKSSFIRNRYFIDDQQIFSIHQAIVSAQPIIVDGPPGTGKTELAKQIAIAMGLDVKNRNHFGKLFCTPDVSKDESIYSWNDAKRLMDQQLIKDLATRLNFDKLLEIYQRVANNTYSERYLDIKVLLRHCIIPFRSVILIDEVDKTYPEYDNYLLDILVNNNFEIPEYGSMGRPNRTDNEDTTNRPIFVLTTNRERDLSGPLARRCKPVWFNYLPENLEAKVVEAKCEVEEMEAGQVAQFFKKIRINEQLHLQQPPSTAEVIETINAIVNNAEHCFVNGFNANIIFQHHCHWIKNRRDFEVIHDRYTDASGNWKEVI